MKKAVILSILCGAAMTACVSTAEDREKYAAMDCKTLSQLAENQTRTAWIDQADLYNDEMRNDERYQSDSPWANRDGRTSQAEENLKRDRDLVRSAYMRKGCAKA